MTTGWLDNWKDIIGLLDEHMSRHNATVSRQISMALDQLIAAESIEQYQEIGIVMRNAWIEFSQSIFRPEFLPDGVSNLSLADAKRLVEYSLKQARGDTGYLLKMSQTAFNLCNKLEHDLNAIPELALQCITSSALCMGLIYQTMSSNDLLTGRPYYKCPKCGSIKLEIRERWEPDMEGAFKVDVLTCADCGWYYIEEMGGMSGVRE